MTVYFTSDMKRVVPEGDPESAFGIAESDIDRLGLGEVVAASAAPEPAVKEVTRPPDKRRKFKRGK